MVFYEVFPFCLREIIERNDSVAFKSGAMHDAFGFELVSGDDCTTVRTGECDYAHR